MSAVFFKALVEFKKVPKPLTRVWVQDQKNIVCLIFPAFSTPLPRLPSLSSSPRGSSGKSKKHEKSYLNQYLAAQHPNAGPNKQHFCYQVVF